MNIALACKILSSSLNFPSVPQKCRLLKLSNVVVYDEDVEDDGGNQTLAKIRHSQIHTQIVGKPKKPQNVFTVGLVINGVITPNFLTP